MTNEVASLPRVDAKRGQPATRRKFLAVTAGAVGALCLASSTPVDADILDKLKKIFDLDPTVLNYAAELEDLQSQFFERALRSEASNALEDRERSTLAFIAMQDKAHFDALSRELKSSGGQAGGHFYSPNTSASPRPRIFNFPASAFRSRENLLHEAINIKSSAVSAYHGAVGLIKDHSVLGAAAAIAGVDGRHLAVLREIAGIDPVPTSFEIAESPQKQGNRLRQYGFTGGSNREGKS